jgi:hypothetical protein
MNINHLMLKDSTLGFRLFNGVMRSTTVFLTGALFERSVNTLFENPAIGLGGLAATYCLQGVIIKEVKQIRSEYLTSSRLSNMVRFQLPLLGIAVPLLAFKAAGVNLTCLAIATLYYTSVTLLSPIITRHQWQIDKYILCRMGIHVSNLAAGDQCKNGERIRNQQREIESAERRPLIRRIKDLTAALNQLGIYPSGQGVIEITEVKEDDE